MKISKLIFNGNLLKLDDPSYQKNLDYANELYESYLKSLAGAGVNVGEFVLRKDGTLDRVTVGRYSSDDIQIGGSKEHFGYHLVIDGEVDYSGSCSLDVILKKNLVLAEDMEIGRFFFFNRDSGIDKKNQAIHFDMPVRVWKEI